MSARINESGIVPVEYRCLVEQQNVPEKTKSGLYIPESEREKRQHAEEKCLLVAVGGNAFEDWKGIKPSPGFLVFVARHTGSNVEGENGIMYKLINDKDITAIVMNGDDL